MFVADLLLTSGRLLNGIVAENARLRSAPASSRPPGFAAKVELSEAPDLIRWPAFSRMFQLPGWLIDPMCE